eukprot:INCI4577.1.p1 GENE.INCI4577.1~~INCI4577.1.p1  ORF type:complete len:322 (+),score=70.49 INCI4577.1:53-967(+)
MAAEAAPAYFKYGDALLKLVEERIDVFGGGLVPQQPGGDQDAEAPESVEELMSIAWETLEVARNIFLKQPDDGASTSYVPDGPAEVLAFTYQRLGDLQTLNEEYESAISDYLECVEQMKRAKMFRSDIATIYFSLGHTEMLRQKYDDALRYLNAAAPVFETLVREQTGQAAPTEGSEAPKSKGKGKSKAKAKAPRDEEDKSQRLPTAPQADDNKKAKQFRGTLKEIYDLIDSCRAELASPAPAKAAAAAASSTGDSAGVTTIGFGSSSASGVGVTQVGFGNVSFDESEVQTMQVRKKPRTQDKD